MNDTKLYNTAPSNKVFKDLQNAAINVYIELDMHPSYTDEKIQKVKDMKNIRDNFTSIVAEFSENNWISLRNKVSAETSREIFNRLQSVCSNKANEIFGERGNK